MSLQIKPRVDQFHSCTDQPVSPNNVVQCVGEYTDPRFESVDAFMFKTNIKRGDANEFEPFCATMTVHGLWSANSRVMGVDLFSGAGSEVLDKISENLVYQEKTKDFEGILCDCDGGNEAAVLRLYLVREKESLKYPFKGYIILQK